MQKKIIALLAIFTTMFLGSTLALSSYVVNMRQNETYPLRFLDPSLKYVEREYMLVGFDTLREKLNSIIIEEENINISLYFEYLNSGANISINKNIRILPASLTKIPTAMIILKKIENNEIQLVDKIKLTDEMKDSKSGTLHESDSGTQYTVESLLIKSIVDSDNTANKMLYELITPYDIEKIKNELGLEELFDKDGKVSSKEYSRVIRSLYTSSYLKPENSNRLLELMTQSKENRYLKLGIPENTPFAHKYGANTNAGVFNDSGIVYAPKKPYLITVMIESQTEEVLTKERAIEIMKVISETTFNEVVKN